MRPPIAVLSGMLIGALTTVAPVSAQNLDIYYIDTEGGQSTLYVAPSGESLLVDTGNPGDRDHNRLMATLQAAGVQRIDHLFLTHFHIDHYGGLEALAAAVPVMNYYDHGESAEAGRGGTDAYMAKYKEITAGKRHIVKPGDKIPFAGVDVTVVTSHTELLRTPIAGAPGAGQPNAFCASHPMKDLSPFMDIDNDYSAGFVMQYGTFRTINLGDFTWNLEYDLMCPNNPIGTIDLYLTSHHGLDRSGGPALVHGLQPRVAIMNNGTRKGGSGPALRVLWESPGLEDVWMLHWAYNGGIENNAPGIFVSNLDEPEVLAGVINPPARPATPAGPAPAPGAPAPGAGPGGPAPGGAPAGPGGPGGAPGAGPGGPGGPGGFGGGAAGPSTPAAHEPAYNIRVSAQQNGAFTVTNERNNFSKTYAAHD